MAHPLRGLRFGRRTILTCPRRRIIEKVALFVLESSKDLDLCLALSGRANILNWAQLEVCTASRSRWYVLGSAPFAGWILQCATQESLPAILESHRTWFLFSQDLKPIVVINLATCSVKFVKYSRDIPFLISISCFFIFFLYHCLSFLPLFVS